MLLQHLLLRDKRNYRLRRREFSDHWSIRQRGRGHGRLPAASICQDALPLRSYPRRRSNHLGLTHLTGIDANRRLPNRLSRGERILRNFLGCAEKARLRAWIRCSAVAFLAWTAQAATASSASFLALGEGFCTDGVYSSTMWPTGKRPAGLRTWGSYCEEGDAGVGHAESQGFPCPPILSLYLAGYPGSPGARLFLKNVKSGAEMDLRTPFQPAEMWQYNSFPVPPDWVGQPVQVVADDRATGNRGWLGFSEPIPSVSSLFYLPFITTSAPQTGFCPDGVYEKTTWPIGGRPAGIVTHGSHCKGGDASTGWAASAPFMARDRFCIYAAGYSGRPGLRTAVETVETGRQLLLEFPEVQRERWGRHCFLLPADWSGRRVRIVAEDQVSGPTGWLAFSDSLPVHAMQGAVAVRTAGLVLLLSILLLLPACAACMVAALRGIKYLTTLTAVALVSIGVTGYVSFWSYFYRHSAGRIFSWCTVLLSLAIIIWACIAKSRRPRLMAIKQLMTPACLVVLASVFIVSFGLLYGGEDMPYTTAAQRFSHPLPPDNTIPTLFAEGIFAGEVPKPLIGDWLSSDRPPLQSGVLLWTYVWQSRDREVADLALSAILQCLFLAGLWSFLSACNMTRRCRGLIVTACLFSGFVCLNGFYTWPKLFPAAFLLSAAAYLLTDRPFSQRHRLREGALAGALAGLAMLCHGGSMFALLGLGFTIVLVRRLPSFEFLAAMAAAAALLYVPWMLYQRLYDPPGDRLLKWHIGGTVRPVPQESLTEVLLKNYRELSLKEMIHNKRSNFEALAGDLPEAARQLKLLVGGAPKSRYQAAGYLRDNAFSTWIPCVGLAVFGPLALLASPRKRPEFKLASRLWFCIGLTLVLWCLLMFGPATTGVHQGTYFTVILAFAGSWLAFWNTRPALAVAATVLNVTWNIVLFVWLMPLPVVEQPGAAPIAGVANVTTGAAIRRAWMNTARWGFEK
jgi:hypothetical protein